MARPRGDGSGLLIIIKVLIYRNAILIYNPVAGKLRGRRSYRVDRVADTLRAAGHTVMPIPTPGPGTAGRIARDRIEAGADLILALGGDGTINELLSGVAHTGVPLAAIPAGTANVLTREVGLGCNTLAVARRLAQGVPKRVSVGVLRSAPDEQPRYFLLMAGIGFDAHIVYNLNLPLKARLGQFAYWSSSFKEIFRPLDEFHIRVNGREHTCSFALASRVRNYAGYLTIARGASLTGHDFEVVLFEGTSTLRYYLKYLGAVLAGRAANIKGVRFLRAEKVEFVPPAGPRVYVQVDGEYAGRLPASVEIERDAVTLLVPPEFAAES